MPLVILFLFSFALSFLLAYLLKQIAPKLGLLDLPGEERKIHKHPIPLTGGYAIFLSFFAVAFLARNYLLSGNLLSSHWLGVFVGALILMIGGCLDDKYHLSPQRQFIFPVLAILSVIIGGVGVEKITSPWGGFLHFNVLSSGLLIFLWLLGMMYTTKLLDGLDGLVTGIGLIGSLIIALFTFTTRYYQPDIGVAALIFSGALLGFLVWNWNPAKIFLGEGGSLLVGFILGVLAIISGGKIAIALLVMGLPILDVVWTIVRRLSMGKNPFRFADRKHLHFRLLDLGLTQKQTALVFYFFSFAFGLSALFLQSIGKIYALVILVMIMLGIILGFNYLDRRKRTQIKKEDT